MKEQRDQLIVGQHLRVERPVGRFVLSETRLQIRPSGGKISLFQVDQPTHLVADYLRGSVAAAFAQVANFRGELLCSLQIAAEGMIDTLAVEGGQHRARPVQRRCQLPRPGVSLAQLRHCPAPARDRYLAEADLQVELDFPAPIGVG